MVRKMMTKKAGKEIGERAVKFLGSHLNEKAVATKKVPIIVPALERRGTGPKARLSDTGKQRNRKDR